MKIYIGHFISLFLLILLAVLAFLFPMPYSTKNFFKTYEVAFLFILFTILYLLALIYSIRSKNKEKPQQKYYPKNYK